MDHLQSHKSSPRSELPPNATRQVNQHFRRCSTIQHVWDHGKNVWQEWKVALIAYQIHGQLKREVEAVHEVIICPPDASHSLHALQARANADVPKRLLDNACCAVLAACTAAP